MNVQKRNGEIACFDLSKITTAIQKAFDAEHVVYDNSILDLLTLKVTADFQNKIKNDVLNVEDIQDSVENILIQTGFTGAAKAFILYRKNHEKIREMKSTVLDYKNVVNSYVKAEDWRVKENSTVTYSVGGLILHNSGAMTANYWLSEVYDEEISNAHRNADIHIHDLSMLTGYCFTGDTKVKLLDGTEPTFEELVMKRKTDSLWIYAYDIKQEKIVPAKAINPRITRLVNELAYVTLDNGETIKCTPDHLFLTRQGTYVKASELKKNMSLMPIYINSAGRYLRINPAWGNPSIDRCYLHRWVMENVLGRALEDGEVVHHIDGNKHNNSPENLEVLLDTEHRKMEVMATMKSLLWQQNNAKRLDEYNRSESKRQEVSQFAYSRERDVAGRFNNHKVIDVSIVTFENPIPVYDLTVPQYENFALASGVFVHNCAGWSLKQLIQEGLGGIPGKITSAPASHLSTLCNQMVNFLGIMQNEWAGAQAFSSFDTYLAPFIRKDNLTYKEVKQCIQSFVYGVNTPSRWGTQAPFSNITLDWVVPADLAELPCIVGGKEMDFCYKDCKKEMDMVNKAFIEIMIEGDANGRGFQYPIPTYSITRDFDWSDTENNRLLFEMTAKYGTPYFSNYVNSEMEPSDVRSMCCRLRLDLRELRKKSGGFFGSGESTGSIGVVTINMPRIAYQAENEEDYFERLGHIMDVSARSLKVKRDVITKLLEEGLYPYTKRYLGSFNNHFSTIGLVGMNEAGLNAKWLKKDMTTKETQEFTKKTLNFMRNRLSDYQEKYGDLYNLEATPAESTSYRLAKHDRDRWPDIITAGKHGETPYYTNSSHLPVSFTEDVFSALDVQDEMQTLYTSGTVFHAFLGEKLPDWKAAAKLVKSIAENYKLPYYTMSPTYSVCKTHGYLAGEQFACPFCGEKTEVYSRITGYYRPVQNWNEGKSQEYKDRKEYSLGHSHNPSKKTMRETTETTSTKLEDGTYLFTTKTCPNCKIAKGFLDGVNYTTIDAEENPELASSLGIMQAPVLVVVKDGEKPVKYVNASNIKRFAETKTA